MDAIPGRFFLVPAVAAALLDPLAGCADLPGQGRDRAFDPSASAAALPDYEVRAGLVTWELVSSDCPVEVQAAWQGDEWGTVTIDHGRIAIDFQTMPLLEGDLEGTEADVAGQMTFMGMSGDAILCDVDGTVQVSDAAVSGEATERLSSPSEVNCVSVGRYTLHPE